MVDRHTGIYCDNAFGLVLALRRPGFRAVIECSRSLFFHTRSRCTWQEPIYFSRWCAFSFLSYTFEVHYILKYLLILAPSKYINETYENEQELSEHQEIEEGQGRQELKSPLSIIEEIIIVRDDFLSIILILYSILYSNTLHSIVAASLDSNGNGVGES